MNHFFESFFFESFDKCESVVTYESSVHNLHLIESIDEHVRLIIN